MQNEEGNVSPLRAFFRKKWVRVVLCVNLIMVIVVIGAIIYNSTKTSSLVFNVTPIDATISVNGNNNYSNGMYKFTPGTYEITISHTDLKPKTFTVKLEPHCVYTIVTFLVGQDNNFEFYELKENVASTNELQKIASADENITTDHDASAEQFISEYKRKMSIMELLPLKGYVHANQEVGASTAGFTIRNGFESEKCKKMACLLVNYYGIDYEEAVQNKIKDAGYSANDYEIVYERYQR